MSVLTFEIRPTLLNNSGVPSWDLSIEWELSHGYHESDGHVTQLFIFLVENEKWDQVILQESPLSQNHFGRGMTLIVQLEMSRYLLK
jgi:hypothetical protein